MNDVAMVVLTAAFFVIAWRYVRACERIERDSR
jgi:hypothetical protein